MVVMECFITRVHACTENPERGRSVLLGVTDDTWEKTDEAGCVWCLTRTRHLCVDHACLKSGKG
jgi:hypothetical protein